MTELEELARRFAGIDVQHRRDGHNPGNGGWPQRWRARLVTSKNERYDYRITVYGDSMGDVIAALLEAVNALDNPLRPQAAPLVDGC